jgi:hypothetical protein
VPLVWKLRAASKSIAEELTKRGVPLARTPLAQRNDLTVTAGQFEKMLLARPKPLQWTLPRVPPRLACD